MNTSTTPPGRPEAAPIINSDDRPILVTGGGGFLGGHIVRKLLARGERVRVYGRRDYPELKKLGVACRQGDLADADAVRDAVSGCRAIVHSAAIPGVAGNYQMYYSANFLGTKNILDAAAACCVERLVYTSTPSVVHGGHSIEGGDESLPYPLRFVNPYAETKALAEKLILGANSPTLATAAIRPHLIYGPGDTQLIPKLLERAKAGKLMRVGDGRNLVSVSYVENVADAHILALDRLEPGGRAAGQAYFVNEPEPVNCWDFINRVVTGVGLPPITKSVPFRVAYAGGWVFEKVYGLMGWKGDPRLTRFLAEQLATSHWFSVEKARRDLNWRPAVSFDDGIEKMLEDMRARFA